MIKLTTILAPLLCATLAATVTAAPNVPEVSAPINTSARAQAAELIAQRQADFSKTSPASADAYQSLAKEVLALGDIGPAARARIEKALVIASQQPDPAAASATLEKALRWLESDIRFTPTVEAPIPEGFPTPTLIDEIELKTYPTYRMVTATPETMKRQRSGRWWARGDNNLFFALFDHINQKQIPMTTPVEMNMGEGNRAQRMGFMYLSTSQGTTGPDGAVDVVDVPASTVLSIGQRGYTSDAIIQSARSRLEAYLATRPDLEPAGELRVMGWNSPSMPMAKRFFEIQIPVKPRQPQ